MRSCLVINLLAPCRARAALRLARSGFFGCALVLVGLSSCGSPRGGGAGLPRTAHGPVGPLQGNLLYAGLCRSCHGDDGRGVSELAAQLDPPVRDFTQCNFKYRSSVTGTLPSDSDLLRTLYAGIPGTRMPAFSSTLLLPSLEALVQEVKQRCRRFAEESPGPFIPGPGRAAYSEESVARGRAVYRRERCSACHGEEGRGDGVAARVLKDGSARRVRPRDFTQGIFRGGYSRLDIYRAFSTGLDGTPMPAILESIPRAERWDLTNYLGSLGRTGEGRPRPPQLEPPAWYERLRAWGCWRD